MTVTRVRRRPGAPLIDSIDFDAPAPAHAAHLGPCWHWQAARTKGGYGSITIDGRTRYAHVVIYERLVGPVPAGLELDHACKVRHCVSPRHLEAVTHRENLLRGNTIPARNAAKTECPHGHPYDDENTGWRANGKRWCRRCDRQRVRLARVAGRMAARRTRRAA